MTFECDGPGKRSYRYNADGLMTEQALRKDATELFRTAYRYDPAGNLTERHDSEFGTDVYLYDPMGRILAHTDPRGAIHRFLNDPAGDRLLTRIAESDGWKREGEYQGTRYRFNRAGNLVRKDDAGKRLDLAWDASQRLIASHRTDAGGRRVTTTYAYDPLGRRLFKETDGRRTWFGWDVDALALDVIDGKPREFVYRPGTLEPLAMLMGSVWRYVNASNGSPVRLLDERGETKWAAGYSGWGSVKSIYVEKVENPIRLQGQYRDEETGLHYNRYRYFCPQIGLFISKDPIGIEASANPYFYGWNVISWFDPYGLATVKLYDIVNYGTKQVGLEMHHGVLDVWASHNVPGYVSRASHNPAIALTKTEHDFTKKAYRDWLEKKTGRRVGGAVDWSKVSRAEVNRLAEKMFDEAKVPKSARKNYYQAFSKSLRKGCKG
jgi:RHS repeat-associated protein